MPRAKYIQNMVFNVLGTCIASAISLLGLWSGVQARKHTTPPDSKVPILYNSSQSAVCAIWLFANIWFANTLRAKFPALQFPVILYSIFTNVAFTLGPIFQTTAQGEEIIKQLLIGFFTAFAISAAVNLFVLPVTCRTVVFKTQTSYISAIRNALKSQTLYLRSLETSDMFAGTSAKEFQGEGHDDNKGKKGKTEDLQSGPTVQTPEAKALKGAISGITALHGKLHGDILFAKREAAWGKLDAKDIDQIYTLLRAIIIPLIGMSTISDIFERVAERRGWVKPQKQSARHQWESWEQTGEEERISSQKTWNEVMKTLHEPFAKAVEAMDRGLEHAGLLLELLPKPKTKNEDDEEAKGAEPRPGSPEFSNYMEQKMLNFYNKRGETLRAWAREKGLTVEQFNAAMNDPLKSNQLSEVEAKHRRDQQQLYLILFMEHLLYSTGKAIGALVRFADKKVEDGTMKKNRLIFPGKKRLMKWILGTKTADITIDNESPDSLEAGTHNIYLGAGFNPKKDPEHLPPTTAWVRALITYPFFPSECGIKFRLSRAS